ncbi:DUF3087 domain-containing protein [Catenovulum sp. 2E275]|uniref:DUF3087 domain-containing protein n=1 Tax=Catenovulum sp. 2E275 TaxID=2980497 RepID=UPI0021D0581B|nr:DUF3087 domain-containing protein [Catenovulum sp. 2E275]MCU4675186.1 DUF3087 domain-containing protein [Catenovulum sp. 2E275]
MQLQKIDKITYRSHLNRVIIACIASLTIGSLGIAQGLIALFPDPSGSHFHWNLTGVIISCIVIAIVLNKTKHHPYMREVYYVWQLKHSLNLITRKLKKVRQAADDNNINAMQILHYYYQGCRQLWQLDDNTITIDELTIWQAKLDTKANELSLELNKTEFSADDLHNF